MIEKLRKQLAGNWANCDRRFKKVAEPGPDYSFSLEARQAMKAPLTDDEIVPYALVEWLARRPERLREALDRV